MPTELRERLQSALGDGYRVERELGGGGMAWVFLAQDTAVDRKVVVKVLPDLATAVDADRFRREVALTARLQHPNIVPVLTAGESAGLLYYVMPYVEGESLRARIDAAGRLPVSESVRILRDVARALAFAHERHVVHRDVKPENVLLSGRAAAVSDFGIAKALSSSQAATPYDPTPWSSTLTGAGMTVGTLAYIAPEQAVGEDVDHRADVYSFGVMAYELLAGARPFGGRTPQEVVAAHLRDVPRPFADKWQDVPPSLAGLVGACLEKDRARRPGAAALVEALEAVGPSSGHTVRFRAAVGRRRMIGTGLVLAAVMLVGGLVGSRVRRGAADGGAGQSLAVLPFANLSGDAANDFLGDGMSEELISALAKVDDLRVAARTSTFAFKGRNLDARVVGDSLGVRAVLSGSVRRSRDRLRISVQLVRVADGLTLWSETYDRTLDDVLAVQEEIGRAIVGALRVRLLGPAAGAVARRPTADVDAFEFYLRGRFEWNRRNRESLSKALAYYDSAVARDTAFGLAYAGIADAYVVLGNWGLLSTRDAGERSLAAARRAVALTPDLAEAHASLASVLCTYVWDWPASQREFRKAVDLNPGLSATRYFYSRCLAGHGRVDEALEQARVGVRLDPLNPQIASALVGAYLAAGRLDSAAALAERAVRQDPTHTAARYWLATALVARGEHARAQAVLAQMRPGDLESPLLASMSGIVAGLAGDAAAGDRALRLLTRRPAANAFFIAQVYAARGDTDRSLEWLARAAEERSDGLVVFARVFPWLQPLRADPRGAAILRRAGVV